MRNYKIQEINDIIKLLWKWHDAVLVGPKPWARMPTDTQTCLVLSRPTIGGYRAQSFLWDITNQLNLVCWNDTPGRTLDDVEEFFDSAIELAYAIKATL